MRALLWRSPRIRAISVLLAPSPFSMPSPFCCLWFFLPISPEDDVGCYSGNEDEDDYDDGRNSGVELYHGYKFPYNFTSLATFGFHNVLIIV